MLTVEQQHLFDSNIRLASYFAIRQAKQQSSDIAITYDEYHSEALFGLMRACETFDPAKGFKFATYASRVILNAIYMAIRKYKSQSQMAVSLDSYGDPTRDGDDNSDCNRYLAVNDTLYDGSDMYGELGSALQVELVSLQESRAAIVRLYLESVLSDTMSLTRAEIGDRLGCSQSWVSRVIITYLGRVWDRYYGSEYHRPSRKRRRRQDLAI